MTKFVQKPLGTYSEGVAAAKHQVRAARSLLHPDIAHSIAIAESNSRECASIDKEHAKRDARRSSVGAHSDTRDKIKLSPPTLHDKAASNPLLRDILRRIQQSTI